MSNPTPRSAPQGRLADKLVPWILGLAGSTWLVSRNWKRAAAVLQADYACALKLSTPNREYCF